MHKLLQRLDEIAQSLEHSGHALALFAQFDFLVSGVVLELHR